MIIVSVSHLDGDGRVPIGRGSATPDSLEYVCRRQSYWFELHFASSTSYAINIASMAKRLTVQVVCVRR